MSRGSSEVCTNFNLKRRWRRKVSLLIGASAVDLGGIILVSFSLALKA